VKNQSLVFRWVFLPPVRNIGWGGSFFFFRDRKRVSFVFFPCRGCWTRLGMLPPPPIIVFVPTSLCNPPCKSFTGIREALWKRRPSSLSGYRRSFLSGVDWFVTITSSPCRLLESKMFFRISLAILVEAPFFFSFWGIFPLHCWLRRIAHLLVE